MRESEIASSARMARVASNIRLMAREKGVSVEEISARMKITRQTFTDRTVHHPERLTLGNLADAARCLNVTLDKLITQEYRLTTVKENEHEF